LSDNGGGGKVKERKLKKFLEDEERKKTS